MIVGCLGRRAKRRLAYTLFGSLIRPLRLAQTRVWGSSSAAAAPRRARSLAKADSALAPGPCLRRASAGVRANFKARSYLPGVGVFTQPDPLDWTPERLKDPQQLNPYGYARGNPLKYTDPTGEFAGVIPLLIPLAELAKDAVIAAVATAAVAMTAVTAKTGYEALTQDDPSPPPSEETISPEVEAAVLSLGMASGTAAIPYTLAREGEDNTSAEGSSSSDKDRLQPADILMPGGEAVGRPGASDGIRRLDGGLPAAEELFDKLAAGGRDVSPSGYPGKLVELPDGGRVGLRPVSSSADKSPSLDINIPDIPVRKIHFEL